MVDEVRFNWDELTYDEAEVLEERSQQPLVDLMDGKASAKGLRAMNFIVRRRQDPSLKWDDLGGQRVLSLRVGPGVPDPSSDAAESND